MKINANVITARGTDEFTVREWRDMTEGRAYELLQHRIDYMIETKLKACEQAETQEQWRKAQGALESLRAVRALGSVIEQELEQKTKL